MFKNKRGSSDNLRCAHLCCILQPPVALPTSLSLSNPQQTAQITVSYPTPRSSHQQQTQPQKQRVFTGVVSKLHDTFGFVDEDVFFQLRFVIVNLHHIRWVNR